MKTKLVLMAGLSLAAVLGSAPAGAKLRLADHTYYGVARVDGQIVTVGTVSVAIGSDPATVATFTYPQTEPPTSRYVLKVPLDALDPQIPRTARIGDTAHFFVNGEPAGTAVVGDQGLYEQLDLGELLPVLSVADIKVGVNGPDPVMAIFTLTLSKPADQPASVDYATADDTAVAGEDYEATHGTALIPAGQKTATVRVLTNGAGLGSAKESFFLNLSNPSRLEAPDLQAICEITSDTLLRLPDLTVSEAGSVLAQVEVDVTLSRPESKTVKVDYTTADGTALAGKDYLAANGTLSFAPGQTRQSLLLTVLNDVELDPGETFTVKLSNARNAVLPQAPTKVTIADDEASLHDQMDRSSTTAIRSVRYSPDLEDLNAQAADDFTFKTRATITAVEVIGRFRQEPGPSPKMLVQFFQANPAAAALPGATVPVTAAQLVTSVPAAVDARLSVDPVRFSLPLTTPVTLEPGTYWLSVQADLGPNSSNKWYWVYQLPLNGAAFTYRNPGNGYAEGCTAWAPGIDCPGVPGRSLSFRLIGAKTNTVGADLSWTAVLALLSGLLVLVQRRRAQQKA